MRTYVSAVQKYSLRPWILVRRLEKAIQIAGKARAPHLRSNLRIERDGEMSSNLPFEIIHRVLSLLSPTELATCQLVNRHLNAIVSQSLILQYCWNLFCINKGHSVYYVI